MLPEGFSVKVRLNSSLFGVAIHCTVRDVLYRTNVSFPHAELQWITSTFYILTERHICTYLMGAMGCLSCFSRASRGERQASWVQELDRTSIQGMVQINCLQSHLCCFDQCFVVWTELKSPFKQQKALLFPRFGSPSLLKGISSLANAL